MQITFSRVVSKRCRLLSRTLYAHSIRPHNCHQPSDNARGKMRLARLSTAPLQVASVLTHWQALLLVCSISFVVLRYNTIALSFKSIPLQYNQGDLCMNTPFTRKDETQENYHGVVV